MAKAMEMLGDKQLIRTLKTLGPRVARRVLKKALHAAAAPPLKVAKKLVETESGLLKKSLGRVTKVNARKGVGNARVGARNGIEGEYEGRKRVPQKYSHLVELGHVDENGRHVPAHPFLRPAADETAVQSLEIMKDAFASGVAKEAQKAS